MTQRPSILERLAVAHSERAEARLLRRLRVVEHVEAPWVEIEGQRLLAFCNNDYLGLAGHPDVRRALIEAAEREGVGAGAAHLISGHRRQHAALEEELAAWLRRPKALLFSTGYMANLGCLSALVGNGDICLQDKLNHASLIDAAHLSGAELKRYVHADLDSAARQLSARRDMAALLATDGVFSMDGDVAPLPGLAALCRAEGALLMVDDAHGLGVLGPEGRGSVAAANLGASDVPVLMATLGKALGTFGAFVAGSGELIEMLIQASRTYVYTTAMPPAVAAATRVALRLARDEGWRRDLLAQLIARFRAGATQLGLRLCESQTAIQPVILGSAEAALAAARALEMRGIWVPAIRPPTVPKDSARLRVTLTAAHSAQDVDRLLETLAVAVRHLPEAPPS